LVNLKLLIHSAIELLTCLIVAGAVASWLPRNGITDSLMEFTDRLLKPIRRLVKPFGSVDISPIVAIIILQVADYIVRRL